MAVETDSQSPPGQDRTSALAAGLDALDAPVAMRPRPSLGTVIVRSVLPPVVATVVLIAIWQAVYAAGIKPSYAIPSPADTFARFLEVVQDGRAWTAVSVSLERGLLGYGAALVLGTLLGMAMWRSSFLRRAIGPAVSGLQSLPSVAWVPAAIILFSISDAAIYAVVLLGAAPSIANGLLAGFDQVPPLFERVGRVLGLSSMGRMRHVMLPAAMPGYLSGLRQGWAFSWRSLMAAELITASPNLGIGLGGLLNIGRDLSQMDLVITAIGLIFVVGVAIELAVFGPVERRVLHARGLGARRAG